ncbi:urate hydroxylase PuuD [Tardiphaga sp. vice352]|uniref:urate hydroxylase PuuD n=1 Tax=unclassified Tardiphaga TaxID=2631404 RepID=UPI0011648B5E|nr:MULTISPECIES: urate hydroxylase PuuD [unclassified Tardiphaga]MBC7585802.1 urate hydroxylase PuuD [Tardiphaga sp.]QDM16495.1 urate hydroxylase PuuD [Tardiphaga sp. vice278]QDM21519.1 urate hydroxylase PuuD [Tardiphaga sp. vice154]QDM26705.1 urate hydroxylase PuuD [Tardiphaga sp. vice304]QDM31769.1 urate hydroxylase PuuD [Tardiphaga sp. vice352]
MLWQSVATEWLSLIFRWLHVVAAMGWIGSSFYFIALDLSLKPGQGLPDGVKGEAWQVHGGGFYRIVKYLVAPAAMPDELTWFKWEAYTTWLSGFVLVVIVYYLEADLFLVDKSVMDLTPLQAALFSFGSLVLAWLLYEMACRSGLARHELPFAIGGYLFLVGLTYAFTHVLSGRGAFNQIGAIIGTIMVANVFATIIPNQKKIVAALIMGDTPDPRWGAWGKERSLHNNYLTLPVIVLMISNHYPLLFGTRYNWAIVAIVLALGPVIRHFFNARHAGKKSPWWVWGVAALGMIGILLLSAAGPRDAHLGALPAKVDFAAVEEIVTSRCSMCHAAEPVWSGIVTAPKAILLDDANHIRRYAALIGRNAVWSSAMPPGNITEMTTEERATIATWLAAGAPN